MFVTYYGAVKRMMLTELSNHNLFDALIVVKQYLARRVLLASTWNTSLPTTVKRILDTATGT